MRKTKDKDSSRFSQNSSTCHKGTAVTGKSASRSVAEYAFLSQEMGNDDAFQVQFLKLGLPPGPLVYNETALQDSS